MIILVLSDDAEIMASAEAAALNPYERARVMTLEEFEGSGRLTQDLMIFAHGMMATVVEAPNGGWTWKDPIIASHDPKNNDGNMGKSYTPAELFDVLRNHIASDPGRRIFIQACESADVVSWLPGLPGRGGSTLYVKDSFAGLLQREFAGRGVVVKGRAGSPELARPSFLRVEPPRSSVPRATPVPRESPAWKTRVFHIENLPADREEYVATLQELTGSELRLQVPSNDGPESLPGTDLPREPEPGLENPGFDPEPEEERKSFEEGPR